MTHAAYISKIRQAVRATEAEVLTEHSATSLSDKDKLAAKSALNLVNISLVLLFELDYIRNASRTDLLAMSPKTQARSPRSRSSK